MSQSPETGPVEGAFIEPAVATPPPIAMVAAAKLANANV
jgi:hypothetical protein